MNQRVSLDELRRYIEKIIVVELNEQTTNKKERPVIIDDLGIRRQWI